MSARTLRRLHAADAAERRAAERLEAARERLAQAIAAAAEDGYSIRTIADETGRAKSHIGRVLGRG